MKRAVRRHKSRCAKSRLVNELFIINTGHETKEETRKVVQTGGYREQYGRQNKIPRRPQPEWNSNSPI